jgi:hypothetical protein
LVAQDNHVLPLVHAAVQQDHAVGSVSQHGLAQQRAYVTERRPPDPISSIRLALATAG